MATDISETAAKLHQGALVWDNHACLPLRPDDETFLPQLQRCKASGTNVVVINVGFGDQTLSEHFALLDHFRCWLGERPGEYVLAETIADIHKARAEDKLAVFFDIEGAKVIGDDLSLLGAFYKLGVRWMLVAYNRNNLVGGGCHDEDTGLTDFGRDWVREMERVGMMVCCSHTGYKTALEVMEWAEKPVILSHSNPRGSWNHPRNVPDEVMLACAETGGVMGINGIGAFLGENDASTGAIVRAIDHAVQRVGAGHVGLSLDYVFDTQELDDFLAENQDTFPPEWGYKPGMKCVAPEQLPEITTALLGLGYEESDVRAILGENWLRVAGKCWN